MARLKIFTVSERTTHTADSPGTISVWNNTSCVAETIDYRDLKRFERVKDYIKDLQDRFVPKTMHRTPAEIAEFFTDKKRFEWCTAASIDGDGHITRNRITILRLHD